MLTDYEQIRSMKIWKDGVIKTGNFAISIFLMLFGGLFLGVGIFAAFDTPQALTLELNKDKLVFIIPTVGLLVLTFGLIKLLRVAKFRKARFIIASVPTSIGTTLKGRLILPANKIPNDAEIEISLINEEKYTSRSGKNNTTHTKNLSKTNIKLTASQFSKDYKFPDTIACDISIPINNRGKDATENFASHKYRWYLKAYSRIPGANLDLDFTLPIYRTPDSPDVNADITIDYTADKANEILSNSESVSIDREAGFTEKFITGKKYLISSIVTSAIFLFVIPFLVFFFIKTIKEFHYDSAISLIFSVFPIVMLSFGFFFVVAIYLLFLTNFAKRETWVKDGILHIKRKNVFGTKTFSIETDYIYNVKGEHAGEVNGEPFYKVKVEHCDFSKEHFILKFLRSKSPNPEKSASITIANSISSIEEASAIAKKIKDAIGLTTNA